MFCAHCSTPVSDTAKFCHSCGSLVSDAEGQAAATGAMDSSSYQRIERLLRSDTEGEYTVDSVLGKGGMAVVYLATENRLGRKVAIKVLPPEMTFGHGIERFLREARTAAALDHPNIIPIYRISSGDEIFWYAMKLIEGQGLNEVLEERTRLTLDETAEILSPVAEALQYAHDQNVIHRDVKPANVMIDSHGRIVVMDFGIAKALTEGTLTAPGSVVGTPYYMSPEQGMGKPVTPAADQYSVAVMAYRMLSGKVPFEGGSAVDILHQHCMVPAPPLDSFCPDLSPDALRAIHKALEKNPEDRLSSVTAFVRALTGPSPETEGYWYSSGVSETLIPTTRSAKPPLRRRIPTVMIAVAAAVGLVGTAWWFTRGSDVATISVPGQMQVDTGSVVAGQDEAITFPAGTPDTAILTVTGVPQGGTLLINGQISTSPLALDDGNHVVELRVPGSPTQIDTITIVGGQDQTHKFLAVVTPIGTATVTITGIPPGGSLFVDNRPARSPIDLPRGRHSFELRVAGFETQTLDRNVVAGQPLTVAFGPSTPVALGDATVTVEIVVNGRQTWAMVEVDGNDVGRQNRTYRTELAPDRAHSIIVSRSGFVPVDTTVTFAAGSEQTITFNLEREQ